MAVIKTGKNSKRSYIIPFSKAVAKLSEETVARVVPYDGKITQVSIHFPSGCNSLVEVRLYLVNLGGNVEYIVPSKDEEYIALDDVTQPFNINYPIKKDSTLKVDIINHDSVYSHTITAIVVLNPLNIIKKL